MGTPSGYEGETADMDRTFGLTEALPETRLVNRKGDCARTKSIASVTVMRLDFDRSVCGEVEVDGMEYMSVASSDIGARWTKWLEREFTDRKVRGSNVTSASRLPLPRLGQPGSIPALVQPSGGMAVRHRKDATAERMQDTKTEIRLIDTRQIFKTASAVVQEIHIKINNESFNCNTLLVPSCYATRRRHEGWDTNRMPKPRQGKSIGRGRVRTTDPAVICHINQSMHAFSMASFRETWMVVPTR
ncbi:hypothetical protein T265_05342 [Opisthorchis viverrini]|uniref:Uncharacterized protein n=1 Tax=Opisthorchis viverrini TaxID=6198 RepID=A0A074ZJV6_OPIVI|nr:hypothetical protein T265_05342 [Opisthorchis viverrini]KER27618.1 hypothetical protein T265_05342 [Opisthorchis viverrini]